MTHPGRAGGSRGRRLWERVAHAVSWTPPTSTEIGTVVKSGLAAGLSWGIARAVTDAPDPVLASLTAIVVVQVSVRASVRTPLQRGAAVVLGVLLALAIGDALKLNGLTVAVLVVVSLGAAELVLRLPAAAARQVPVSGLVVLSAVVATHGSQGWRAMGSPFIALASAVRVLVQEVLGETRAQTSPRRSPRSGHDGAAAWRPPPVAPAQRSITTTERM